jgi:hypothetical protein
VSDALFYSTPGLHALAPAELGTLLWSLSQLRHRPDAAWLDALYAAAEPLLALLSREEVPLVMYALARLQVRRGAGGGRVGRLGGRCMRPWRAGRLPRHQGVWCRRHAVCLATRARPLCSPPQPHQASPPPRWRAALSDAAAAELPALRQPHLAMLLHALGTARSRAAAPGLLEPLLEELAARFSRLGPQALTTCAWALARLRHVPPRGWLAGFFGASFRLLPSYRTQELAVTLWALGRLRLYPGDPWLDEFFDTSEGLLDVGGRPDDAAVGGGEPGGSGGGGGGGGAAAAAAAAAGQAFSAVDLAMTGYALALLGLRPPKSWARRYCAAVLRHKRGLPKPLLRQVLVALAAFRIGNMDGWRAELYAAAGLRLTRRLRGRRGVKRPRRCGGGGGGGAAADAAAAEALAAAQQEELWEQQEQLERRRPPPPGQWPEQRPPPAPPGARLILDARRTSLGGGGSSGSGGSSPNGDSGSDAAEA